jgi:Carboxypeptidase regulatory-like domain
MTGRRSVFSGALLLLCVGATPTVGSAQDLSGIVHGVVLNGDNGRPIVDASVGVAALNRFVTTDSAGRFRMTGIHFGSQLVEARAIGYRPTWRSVTVVPGDSATLEFRLKPAAVTLPEVVVSTTREERQASTTPLSIGVIGEGEIQFRRRRPCDRHQTAHHH